MPKTTELPEKRPKAGKIVDRRVPGDGHRRTPKHDRTPTKTPTTKVPTSRPRRAKKCRLTMTWNDGFYVRAHELARLGMSDTEVGNALGVEPRTWVNWSKRRPQLREAMRRARSEDGGAERFEDYVYKRLPPHLQSLWDKLSAYDDAIAPLDVVEELFRGKSEAVRQYLWVQAMCHVGFVASEACRIVNVSEKTVRRWGSQSPAFADMLERLKEMRLDFFEKGVVDLVAAREPSVVVFAAKTQLKGRGFGTDKKSLEIHHAGKVDHKHEIELEDLDRLPPEEKRVLLERYRARRNGLVELPPKVVEGTAEPVTIPNGGTTNVPSH